MMRFTHNTRQYRKSGFVLAPLADVGGSRPVGPATQRGHLGAARDQLKAAKNDRLGVSLEGQRSYFQIN